MSAIGLILGVFVLLMVVAAFGMSIAALVMISRVKRELRPGQGAPGQSQFGGGYPQQPYGPR